MLNLCMRRHFGISPGFPYASRDVGVSLSVQADDETLAAEAARNWTDGIDRIWSHRCYRCYRCYAGSINPWSHEHQRMKLCSGMLNSILIHLNSWFFSKLDFETFWVYNSTTFVALVTGVCKLASWSWAGQSQPTDVCGSWHCNGRFQAQLTTNAIPTSTSLALSSTGTSPCCSHKKWGVSVFEYVP